MYGLRTVMPFVFGLSRFDPKRFAALNFIGAFLWALIFGLTGYVFGQIMEVILVDVSKYETWIALGILLMGIFIWLNRWHANRKEKGVHHE